MWTNAGASVQSGSRPRDKENARQECLEASARGSWPRTCEISSNRKGASRMIAQQADAEEFMNTSETAMAQSGLQAQGAELPARRRAAAPLHGDDRRRRGVPDRRPGLQDVPGDAGHLEGDPVDRPGRSGDRPGAAGAVRATATGSCCGGSSASASCWCFRSARVGILHHPQGGGPAATRSPASSAASATTGWGRRRPSLRKGDELQEFYLAFREMHQALRARVEDDVRVLEERASRPSRRRPRRRAPCHAERAR